MAKNDWVAEIVVWKMEEWLHFSKMTSVLLSERISAIKWNYFWQMNKKRLSLPSVPAFPSSNLHSIAFNLMWVSHLYAFHDACHPLHPEYAAVPVGMCPSLLLSIIIITMCNTENGIPLWVWSLPLIMCGGVNSMKRWMFKEEQTSTYLFLKGFLQCWKCVFFSVKQKCMLTFNEVFSFHSELTAVAHLVT